MDDYAANNLSVRIEPEGEIIPILHDVQFLNTQGRLWRLRHAASFFLLYPVVFPQRQICNM